MAVGAPAAPVAGAPSGPKADAPAAQASAAPAPAPAGVSVPVGGSGGSASGTEPGAGSVSGTAPSAAAGSVSVPVAGPPAATAVRTAVRTSPPKGAVPGAPVGKPARTSPPGEPAGARPGGAAPAARVEVPTRTAPQKAPAPSARTKPATETQASASPAPAKAPAPPVSVPPAPAEDRPAPGGDPAPDFGRIRGARVAAVALPVAGVVRVARRRNVIGTETTGSIPVHLLFRDEPETAAPGAKDDDGGPDTVAMAAPAAPGRTRGPGIPGPSKTPAPDRAGAAAKGRARHAAPPPSSRPAPTADPALVERPGSVLPGWVGAVAGALALAWCGAIVWWTGAVPAEAARMLRLPVRPYHGVHLGQWALLALGVVAVLFAFGGLGRGRVGYAWVLTLFGDYRGTVRRTGLIWVSPLLLRRRVDVRLRHWRSEPLPAVDARGTALDVVVLVVWRVRDTVRASLGVDGHEEYLREQVEAAMARVLSQLPADAFHEDAPTLRDAEAVGEALTRMLSAECAPVGLDVFSAQPTRIEYAPEVATAMRRSRIAALDAKHRDAVLTSVVDAVDDVVHRLTSRGLVELDDYERKALVKDLTVAFYTGRTSSAEGA
ncbi:SPFH domain-containing protein [Streptomyces bikiniensis]|uniref:SPFH domain-containing protein n=1 Tax=Streptomyces bikiniensis TaxID=1896 RepID=A0ABW8CMZ7_STRBI